MSARHAPVLDAVDRRLVLATQSGLPLDARPFARLAETLELSEDEVIARMRALQERGVIRRIAAVPNHYALGVRANGMSVWDVDDDRIAELGPQVGALPFVSHCYRRPRVLPNWRYNLFAMIHGRSRDEVLAHVETVRALLGADAHAMDVLFSTAILKKTGLRLVA